MLEYRCLTKACRELKLNPNIVGDNPNMDGHPEGTFADPFDLGSINFPKKEMEQVLKIGQIIYNLESQVVFPHYFNLTNESGKKRMEKHHSIRKILPFLKECIEFWFDSGLKKCKSDKKFLIFNGNIFEIDPLKQKKMIDMNFSMEKVN